MELVYVEWEDASAVDEHTGWVEREDAPAPHPIIFHQVGFVFDAGPDAIVLTEAYSEHQMAPRTRIPMGMLRKLVYLDPKRGRSVAL